MQYDEIKVGDQLRLVSGGPVMTVRFVITDEEGDEYEDIGVHCQWFSGDSLREAIFPPESLCPP